MSDTLSTLVELTREIGLPQHEYVIVGEGNTSARRDDHAFWVKASGQQMHHITPQGFVEVQFAPILGMLEQSPGDLAAQKQVMEAAKVDPAAPGLPSVEVTFHAMLLHECKVNFVGHTHALAVNRILCSPRAVDFATRRMFPDEAVLCGPESVLVPYVDPGLPLALAIRASVRDFMEDWGEAPKVILLQNHGIIVLGQTPQEILNIMGMAVKSAHIFAGAAQLGGPVFLSPEDVLHIVKRPDEIYRRKLFVERGG
jgi:rhamnose utilization protein RhaD (predicted bifunctional aldolase and dehydrogenase)